MAESLLPALLALASHELRAPAGVARGYLRLLEQDASLTDRHRRIVGDTGKALARVAALLDEVSELARLLNGEAAMTRRPLDLPALLHRAAGEATLPAVPEVTAAIEAPAEAALAGDESRLAPAFSTLLTALGRAQSEPGIIDVRVTPPRTAGRGVTQILISPRRIGGGRAVSRPVDLGRGGLGLTLAIADTVIKAHGGRLRERWIDGRWAGFVVRL